MRAIGASRSNTIARDYNHTCTSAALCVRRKCRTEILNHSHDIEYNLNLIALQLNAIQNHRPPKTTPNRNLTQTTHTKWRSSTHRIRTACDRWTKHRHRCNSSSRAQMFSSPAEPVFLAKVCIVHPHLHALASAMCLASTNTHTTLLPVFVAPTVLINKLLLSCPNINAVYLLVRKKKGKDVQTRVDEIFDETVGVFFLVLIDTSSQPESCSVFVTYTCALCACIKHVFVVCQSLITIVQTHTQNHCMKILLFQRTCQVN